VDFSGVLVTVSRPAIGARTLIYTDRGDAVGIRKQRLCFVVYAHVVQNAEDKHCMVLVRCKYAHIST